MPSLQENFALFSLQSFRDQADKDECYIAFISGWTKHLVLSCLRYATYYNTRWYVDDPNQIRRLTDAEIDEIEEIVDGAHAEIVMTCNAEDLIRTQRMIVAALTGTAVDLTTDLPDSVDYTANGEGVSKTIKAGNDQATIDLNALKDELEALKDMLAAKLDTAAGNADDLEEILDAINIILGGAAILGV